MQDLCFCIVRNLIYTDMFLISYYDVSIMNVNMGPVVKLLLISRVILLLLFTTEYSNWFYSTLFTSCIKKKKKIILTPQNSDKDSRPAG